MQTANEKKEVMLHALAAVLTGGKVLYRSTCRAVNRRAIVVPCYGASHENRRLSSKRRRPWNYSNQWKSSPASRTNSI
jgi:hypothetical protein